MARTTDDGALRRSRSRRSWLSGRNCTCLQGYMNAASAHCHLRGATTAFTRSTRPAKQAERNRPDGRGEGSRLDAFPRTTHFFGVAWDGVSTCRRGSGIMAQRLAGGNVALALLCNTTGAILAVLILIFLVPISTRPQVSPSPQVVGGLVGVWAAHLMFELPVWQISTTPRAGPGQWFAEAVASFRLASYYLRLCSARARRSALCGRALHYLPLLVYSLDIICQPGGNARTCAFRHVCRHRARWRAGLHHGAAWHVRCRRGGDVAVADCDKEQTERPRRC